MLTLTRLVLENYRGVDRLEIDFGETTVLIGENNVGKTSVLEALDACLGTRATRRSGPFEDYDHRRAGSQRELPDGHELRVTITFREDVVGEWSADAAAALNEVIQLEEDGRRSIVHRVSDVYDAGTRGFSTSTAFLNLAGDELRPSGAPARTLRRFVPVFYFPADRDAGTGFRPGAPFWAPFLRDPKLPEALRQDLEGRLRQLNQEVIAATPALGPVRERLDATSELVDLAEQDTASIESLPSRIPELLRRTEVRLSARSGASLPLAHHGGGTQNLAVLALFEAYLASMLAEEYEADARPILAVEEPEAHLHPSATRSVWAVLERMPGQRVIATHSGELLSRSPLSAVRRLVRRGGSIGSYRMCEGTLSPEDTRRVDFHVRRARGELLFARVWLLGEGETEFWVFQGAAEGQQLDLERDGIRVVEFAQTGSGLPLAKLADDLGVGWHFALDGDDAGRTTQNTIREHLGGRPEADHLSVLPHGNMERFLCEEGFGDLYESELSQQQLDRVSVPSGDPSYWEAVADLPNSKQKTRVAAAAAEEMRSGARPVPPQLVAILDVVKRLSQG